ncbi:hypothetical protein F5144DRAFT_611801 [Chaetomium tenue]|uniref:Uncharacterized protein n=1 Tax=Chaetomium tenue TaxID=1854479 RepID=A0ACB7PDD3_9PEZI|nr:hypothetical protein F5144DRAFT_611801 [Chaetomium globosum]
MLSSMILALLLPSALAFATPRAAGVIGRQEVDDCGCERSADKGGRWGDRPSWIIGIEVCRELYGGQYCSPPIADKLLCVFSEDQAACSCVAQAAEKWEFPVESGGWYMPDITCKRGNATIVE